MTAAREGRGEPRLLRGVVIAVLAIHLANSAAMTFGALLTLGHGMPYVIGASGSIVILALFAAVLVSFIRRGSRYLQLAAVAGIGGCLITMGVSWLRYGILIPSVQSLVYFLFPVICLSMYRLVSRRRQAA